MERGEKLLCHRGWADRETGGAVKYYRSFSSNLLDAIYRSIDDGHTAEGEANVAGDAVPGKSRRLFPADRPDHRRCITPNEEHFFVPKSAAPARLRPCTMPSNKQLSFPKSASPPDVRRIKLVEPPTWPLSIRTRAAPETWPEMKPDRKRSKPRKTKTPVSPGKRLAGFLHNLFSGAGSPRKTKPSSLAGGGAAAAAPACNCPTARFFPLKLSSSVKERKPAIEERKRVFEWFADMEKDNDGQDDRSSCSSSDLFELQILTNFSGGNDEKRCLDELPVYKTTRLDRCLHA